MKKENFINILDNNATIGQVETAELKSVVDEYPYFQAAKALYLKGLHNQDSFKYNKELKITAAYTTDRAVLFDFITSRNFINSKEEIHQKIIEKISEEKIIASPVLKKTFVDETLINNTFEVAVDKTFIEETAVDKHIKPIKKITKELKIGTPISFTDSENYSFNEWLQLSTKKPIVREEISSTKEEEVATKNNTVKEEIIEKFIQNNPKIAPLSKDKNVTISVSKNKHDSSLMTETLAKVYLEQKKYENAIQAYRILILKYPEKSGYFADQIKRIQILQKHK